MAGKAVESVATASVPDLVRTPALEITAEDVALLRIKIGQFQSKAVQNKLVEAGELYASSGQDDPNAYAVDSPMRFYVLAMKKGLSYSEKGEELQTWTYGDPDADPRARITWDYTIAAPELESSMPYKMLLANTGTPAAKNMNYVLGQADGPHWKLAFEIFTKEKENPKGKYWIPQIRHVDAADDEVKIADELVGMLSSQATELSSDGVQPDI